MCKACESTADNIRLLTETGLGLIKYDNDVIPQEPDRVRLELMRHVLVMVDDDTTVVEMTGMLLNFIGHAYNAAVQLLDVHQGSVYGAINALDERIAQDAPVPGHGIPDVFILRGRREPSRITSTEWYDALNRLFRKGM